MVLEDRKGPGHAFGTRPAGRFVKDGAVSSASLRATTRNGRSVQMGASGSPSLLAVHNHDYMRLRSSGLSCASVPGTRPPHPGGRVPVPNPSLPRPRLALLPPPGPSRARETRSMGGPRLCPRMQNPAGCSSRHLTENALMALAAADGRCWATDTRRGESTR